MDRPNLTTLRIVNALTMLKAYKPDLRFAQLLSLAAPNPTTFFYMDDEDLADALEAALNAAKETKQWATRST